MRPQPGAKVAEPSAVGSSSCSWSFLYTFDWVVNLCWWVASSSLMHGFLLSIRLSQLLFLTSLFPFQLYFSSGNLPRPALPKPQCPHTGCCNHTSVSHCALHISLLPCVARPATWHTLQCGGQDLSAGFFVQPPGW